jgi:ABC-type amino acid transport substrate-binding protein
MTVLLLVQVGAARAETLLMQGDDRYAPLIFMQEAKVAGVLPAVLARVEKLTGDRYDIRLSPWKRAYALALEGNGGLIGVSYTSERGKLFDFSKPFYNDDIQVVTRADRAFTFTKLTDLQGKLIGGVNGASYGEEVDKAIATGLLKVERDVGQSGRLRKVLAGRLDAALVGNGMAGLNAIVSSDRELSTQRQQFMILPTPLARDPLHIAFAKSMGKTDAIVRFDAAIASMKQSGELQRIISAAAD